MQYVTFYLTIGHKTASGKESIHSLSPQMIMNRLANIVHNESKRVVINILDSLSRMIKEYNEGINDRIDSYEAVAFG